MAQRPSPAQAPLVLPAPEVKSGPHLAYSVQWFLFAGVGVVGWVILIRREASDRGLAATDRVPAAQDGCAEPADGAAHLPVARA